MKWLSLIRTDSLNFPMLRTQIFGRDPSNKNAVDLSLADMDMYASESVWIGNMGTKIFLIGGIFIYSGK